MLLIPQFELLPLKTPSTLFMKKCQFSYKAVGYCDCIIGISITTYQLPSQQLKKIIYIYIYMFVPIVIVSKFLMV